MARTRIFAAMAAAAVILGGCSFTDEALLPSLAGESAAAQPAEAAPAAQPSAAVQTASLPVGSSGTYVGQKAQELRAETDRLQAAVASQAERLAQLRAQIQQNAEAYHGTVAAISSKLQVGTTPGNPILVQQWNDAEAQLQQVSAGLGQLNSLSNDVSASAALAGYLLESTRASFNIAGALDEDHVQLARIEDDINRTTVEIDRLLDQLAGEIARQTAYLSGERSNLTTLALAVSNGEAYGQSLASRIYAASTAPSAPAGAGAASGRPLVVIRFDRPNVAYEQPLFDAVSQALERRPGAAFDLVAVAPGGGSQSDVALGTNAARRNAESVMRSLITMGLPPERVSLSATTSGAVQTPEVHLYVR